MKMKKFYLILCVIGLSVSSFGQTVIYSNSFDNVPDNNTSEDTGLGNHTDDDNTNFRTGPEAATFCLEKSGSTNYINSVISSTALSVTAGSWYQIDIYEYTNDADCTGNVVWLVPSYTGNTFADFQAVAPADYCYIGDNYQLTWGLHQAYWQAPSTGTVYIGIYQDYSGAAQCQGTCLSYDDWTIYELPAGCTPPGTLNGTGWGTALCYALAPSITYDFIYQGNVYDANTVPFTPTCSAGLDWAVQYSLPATANAVYITLDNPVLTPGNPAIVVTSQTCASPTELFCQVGTGWPTTFTIGAGVLSSGGFLYVMNSLDDWGSSGDQFDMCIGDGVACGTTWGGCTVPGNAFAIYGNTGAGTGAVECDELSATGGATGGIGMMYTIDEGTTESGTNVAISGYDVITADNFSCTTTDITLTDVTNGSNWDNAGPDVFNLLIGTLNSATIEIDYSAGDIGRKDIKTVANTYCDFLNMQVDAAAAGPILGSTNFCPDTVTFTSSDAGTPGYQYQWLVVNPVGGTSTILFDTLPSTGIIFTNSTSNTIRFNVKLVITSECCGPLDTVFYNADVFPLPATPTTITPDTNCVGGLDTMFVSPSMSGFTYNWYNAAVGGTLLEAGDSSYVVNSTLLGSTLYYVEAVDGNGCVSATRESALLFGKYYPPVVPNIASCALGYVTLCVSDPNLGSTYRWWEDSQLPLDSLVQSGIGTCYDVFIDSVGNAKSVIVTNIDGTCDESTGTTATASVPSPASALYFQNYMLDNDWFNGDNWSSDLAGTDTVGCVPSCATNATITSNRGGICHIAFYNGSRPAACQNITIRAGATLKFMDTKSKLEVCGNWLNSGALEMFDNAASLMGRVSFVGTQAAQRLRQRGSGDFYVLEINNTSTDPRVYVLGNQAADRDVIVVDQGELWLVSGLLDMDNALVNSKYCDVQNSDPNAIRAFSDSSYVVGNLKREMVDGVSGYNFPVGNFPGGTYYNSYQLFQILNPSGMAASGMTELTVRFDIGAADDTLGLWPLGVGLVNVLDNGSNTGTPGVYNSSTQDGIWTMEPDAGSANYDLVLQGTYYQEPDTPWITVVKRDKVPNVIGTGVSPLPTAASPWQFYGSIDAPSGLGIQGSLAVASRTGYSGFSQVAIASATVVPLAVDLLHFNGVARNEVVYLDWKTKSEEENDYFIVQRSRNNKDWEEVGRVEGHGTTKDMNDYDFVDTKPYQGVSYYRLMVVNTKGEMYPSNVVSVTLRKEFVVELFPNPAREFIDMNIEAKNGSDSRINVYNSLGELVYSDMIIMKEGSNTYRINLNNFASGVYHLQLKNANSTQNVSFIRE